jgi:hypothetical protein
VIQSENLKVFKCEDIEVDAVDVLHAICQGRDVRLTKCTVWGELDVNRFVRANDEFDVSCMDISVGALSSTVIISTILSFNGCVFKGNVGFASPWDSSSNLEVVFKQDAMFNSSVFEGQARFSGAIFKGNAGFDGCVFKRIAVFREAVFHRRAMYRTAGFEGYGLFNGAEFKDEARFTNTCFNRGSNYTSVKFASVVDFSGVYSKSKSVPVYDDIEFGLKRYGADETFWRFIKQSAQEAGHYRLSGEAFYNERCALFCQQFFGHNFTELSGLGKIKRLLYGLRLVPEYLFGQLLFGYGERPMRILVASIMIIVLCGMFYWSPLAVLSDRVDITINELEFLDGLYFSTTTFTTLGFGDMCPASAHRMTKLVVMFEATSGASLMALFVVCLSKRFSRG